MKGHATAEGTARYADKFTTAAEGHFRHAQDLVLSSIGIGTYLGNPDATTDQAYTDAVIAAARGGVNVIDSAINYRFMRSERSIGAALEQLAIEGIQRDELVLCTKGGYITPDGDVPADPRAYFAREYLEPGILAPEDVVGGSHCMTPRYLEDQLARSLRNLGVECVDVYYLHNPETQLGSVLRATFRARIHAAFEFLESAAAAGKIRFYGMATWNAFRQQEQATDFISLSEMVAVAREVAGDAHRFRFVQLPLNLAMPEALVAPNQMLDGKAVPMVEAAHELGVTLIASASLLQAQLRQGLPPFVREALGQATDLLSALQFTRSAPGVATALVGMSQTAHVAENLKLVGVSPASREQFLKLFDR